ncbi:phage exclusion lipoprotein Cor [Kluyvera ascorbata]|uniref:phage exclusion lipoprotein Cor n=1 Tax=Kluyvera ascorbata TaxID=51288 RepID=UPI0022E1033C|nr:cor protein [Kluyvera ascorbata]
MKKILLVVISSFLLFACSGSFIKKQQPVCEATALIAGQKQKVQIYGVRVVSNQTEYKAGYPFNWRWVNKTNFASSTCK